MAHVSLHNDSPRGSLQISSRRARRDIRTHSDRRSLDDSATPTSHKRTERRRSLERQQKKRDLNRSQSGAFSDDSDASSYSYQASPFDDSPLVAGSPTSDLYTSSSNYAPHDRTIPARVSSHQHSRRRSDSKNNNRSTNRHHIARRSTSKSSSGTGLRTSGSQHAVRLPAHKSPSSERFKARSSRMRAPIQIPSKHVAPRSVEDFGTPTPSGMVSDWSSTESSTSEIASPNCSPMRGSRSQYSFPRSSSNKTLVRHSIKQTMKRSVSSGSNRSSCSFASTTSRSSANSTRSCDYTGFGGEPAADDSPNLRGPSGSTSSQSIKRRSSTRPVRISVQRMNQPAHKENSGSSGRVELSSSSSSASAGLASPAFEELRNRHIPDSLRRKTPPASSRRRVPQMASPIASPLRRARRFSFDSPNTIHSPYSPSEVDSPLTPVGRNESNRSIKRSSLRLSQKKRHSSGSAFDESPGLRGPSSPGMTDFCSSADNSPLFNVATSPTTPHRTSRRRSRSKPKRSSHRRASYRNKRSERSPW
jgi:hypothetical protein